MPNFKRVFRFNTTIAELGITRYYLLFQGIDFEGLTEEQGIENCAIDRTVVNKAASYDFKQIVMELLILRLIMLVPM